MVRVAVTLSLSHSVLLETSILYVNHNIVPFSINMFLMIQSGLHILYIMMAKNAKAKDSDVMGWSVVWKCLWNTGSFVVVLYSILFWSSWSAAATQQQQQHKSASWFTFLVCLDLFACPLTLDSANKSSSVYRGIAWRFIYTILFIVLIHISPRPAWNHNYDLRIDSTRYRAYASSVASASLLQGWLWLVFVAPVIIAQCQSEVFACAYRSIFCYYHNNGKGNDSSFSSSSGNLRMNKNMHLQLLLIIVSIVVVGLNATFYEALRFVLLVMHFVLHWVSHASMFILVLWNFSSKKH